MILVLLVISVIGAVMLAMAVGVLVGDWPKTAGFHRNTS